jgi:hypothetical protein
LPTRHRGISMFSFFKPTLKKVSDMLQLIMIGDKSSQKQMAIRLLQPAWSVLIDEALDKLPYNELNLLKLRFQDLKYPNVIEKLEKLCLARNPNPPSFNVEITAVEKESIRLNQLSAQLEEKAKELLYNNCKTKQVGNKTVDLSHTGISLEYMDRVEIILTCVGMQNQSVVFEQESAEFLWDLCEMILNKDSFEWFDRMHEAELVKLLVDFSLEEDYPQDPLLVSTSVAIYAAVTQDIVTHSYISQRIDPYLEIVNSLRTTQHNEKTIEDIAGIFAMGDVELIQFFKWNLTQIKP